MPRTRSIAWSELKLGIIGVVAFVLLAVAIVSVGGEAGFPWQRYPLKLRFQQISGLKTGAVVRLNGKEVGKVTSIDFAGSQIDVGIDVSKDVRHLITSGSTASLGSLSLLGEPIIDIAASNQGAPLADWAYVRVDQRPALSDLTSTASESLEEAGKLIADVRAGRGSRQTPDGSGAVPMSCGSSQSPRRRSPATSGTDGEHLASWPTIRRRTTNCGLPWSSSTRSRRDLTKVMVHLPDF